MARQDMPVTVKRSSRDGGLCGGAAVSIHLAVFSPGGTRMLELRRNAVLRIGRNPDCDVCIDDETVSRSHARVERAGDEVYVTDLGSSNETLLNGVRLDRKRLVHPGDEITVGGTTLFILRRPARAGGAAAPSPDHDMIVADPSMQAVLDLARRVAAADDPVLITGETGTGKGLLAHEIHRRSPRAGGPFTVLHCASLSESLIEKELFGSERGAFTGATERRSGFLEEADGGTLLLDEIGDVPLSVQVKLLRFLDTGRFSRLGNPKELSVSARIIAATNRDVADLIKKERFRQDLYYRISSFVINIPPLRQRPGDIVALARLFLERGADRHARRAPVLDKDAVDAIRSFSWKGNVRQLRNVMERIIVFSQGGTIGADDLKGFLHDEPGEPELGGGMLRSRMSETAEKEIRRALEGCGGNQTKAARLLGLSRRTLGYKIKKLHIDLKKYR